MRGLRATTILDWLRRSCGRVFRTGRSKMGFSNCDCQLCVTWLLKIFVAPIYYLKVESYSKNRVTFTCGKLIHYSVGHHGRWDNHLFQALWVTCIHLSKAASSDGRIPHEPIYSSLCSDIIKRISNQTDGLVGLFLQSLSYLYMYYLRH